MLYSFGLNSFGQTIPRIGDDPDCGEQVLPVGVTSVLYSVWESTFGFNGELTMTNLFGMNCVADVHLSAHSMTLLFQITANSLFGDLIHRVNQNRVASFRSTGSSQ
jgi:hypothetical protein